MSNTTAQSGVLNLLSSQIVSIKKQILDPSTYTETADEMKWAAVEEEIKEELSKLFDDFKDEVVIMIDTKTSIIFKYKGSVASEAELPSEGNTVGDVYNVEDTGANYAWDGTKWDKLSETIDLSKFITVEDFQTAVQEAVQAEANLRAEADQTLSNTKTNRIKEVTEQLETAVNNLQEQIDNIPSGGDVDISGKVDKEIIGSNGKALIFNESDGGGAKFEFNNNHASFVGVNDDSNGIMAQIYAKDTTTNIGSRINVTKDGIYYTVKNNSTYTAEDEIAVKKDLAELNTQIEEALNEINIKTQSIFHYKGSVADTDALPTEDQEIGDVYNVEADGHNVAWNGTDWDKLSETIDLSAYVPRADFNQMVQDRIDHWYDHAPGLATEQDIIDLDTRLGGDDIEDPDRPGEYIHVPGLEEKVESLQELAERVETAEHALFEYEDPESGDYNAGLVSTVADLQVSFNDHETAINNHEQRITTLEQSGGDVGDLTNRVSTIELTLNGTDPEEPTKWGFVQQTREDLSALFSGLAEVDPDRMVEYTEKTDALETRCDSFDEGIAYINEQVSGLDNRISEVSDNCNTYTDETVRAAKLDNWTQLNNRIKAEEEARQTADTSLDTRVSTIVSDIQGGVEPRLTDLEVSCDNLGSTTESLDSRVTALEEAGTGIGELQSKVTKLDNAIFDQKDEETGNIKSGLLSNFEGLSILVNDHEEQLFNMDNTVTTVRTNVEEITNNFDEINSRLDGYSSIPDIVDDIHITVFGGEDPETGDEVEGLTTKVSNMETAVQNEASGRQEQYNYLWDTFSELNNGVDNQFSEVNGVIYGTDDGEGNVKPGLVTEVKQLQTKVDSATSSSNKILSLREMVDLLEKKVNDLQKSDIDVNEINGEGSFSSYMDYILSGTVTSQLLVSEARSVLLKNTTVDNGVVSLYAFSGDIDVKNVTVNDPEQLGMAEAVFTINTDKYVTIRDCSFNIGDSYNGVQFDGMYSPKSILIDNVDFNGEYQYPIMVQSTDEDSVITISNCHFGQVNNAISLYNKENKRFTLNIINCTCDSWGSPESEEDSFPWAGLVRCVDDVSGSVEAEIENNLYGKDKVTINIQNLTKPDGTKLTAPKDMSTICGSMDANQILYVITTSQDVIPYDEDKYPTVNIL